MQISLRLLLAGSFSVLFLIAWILPLVFLFSGSRDTLNSNLQLLTSLSGTSIAGALERQLRYSAVLAASGKNWSLIYGSPFRNNFTARQYTSKSLGELAESGNWILNYWFRRFDDGSSMISRAISANVLQFHICRSNAIWNWSLSQNNESLQPAETTSDCTLARFSFSNGSIELNVGEPTILLKRSWVNASLWRWIEGDLGQLPAPRPTSIYLSILFNPGFNRFDTGVLGIASGGFFPHPTEKTNTLMYGSFDSFSSFGLQQMLKELVPKKRDFGRAAASSTQTQQANAFLLDPNGIVVATTIDEPLYRVMPEGTTLGLPSAPFQRCSYDATTQRINCFYEIDSYPPLALLEAVGATWNTFSNTNNNDNNSNNNKQQQAHTGEVRHPLSDEEYVWAASSAVYSRPLVIFRLYLFIPSEFILGRVEYLFNVAIIVSAVIVVVGAISIYLMLRPIVNVIDDLTSKLAKDPFDPSLMDDFGKDDVDNTNESGEQYRSSSSCSSHNNENFCAATLSNNTLELSELRTSYLDLRFVIERLRSFMPTGHRRIEIAVSSSSLSSSSVKKQKQTEETVGLRRDSINNEEQNNHVSTTMMMNRDPLLVEPASLSFSASGLFNSSRIDTVMNKSSSVPTHIISSTSTLSNSASTSTAAAVTFSHTQVAALEQTNNSNNSNLEGKHDGGSHYIINDDFQRRKSAIATTTTTTTKSVRFTIESTDGDNNSAAAAGGGGGGVKDQQHNQQHHEGREDSAASSDTNVADFRSNDDDDYENDNSVSSPSSKDALSPTIQPQHRRSGQNRPTGMNSNNNPIDDDNVKTGKFLVACVRFHHVAETNDVEIPNRIIDSNDSGDNHLAHQSRRQELIDDLDLLVSRMIDDVIVPTGAHLIEYRNSFFLVALRLSRKKARSRLARRFVHSLIELSQWIASACASSVHGGVLKDEDNHNALNMTVGLAVGDAKVLEMTQQCSENGSTPRDELENNNNEQNAINIMATVRTNQDRQCTHSPSSSATLHQRPLTLLGPVVSESVQADYIIRTHLYVQERNTAASHPPEQLTDSFPSFVSDEVHHARLPDNRLSSLSSMNCVSKDGSCGQVMINVESNNKDHDDDVEEDRVQILFDRDHRRFPENLQLPFAICHKKSKVTLDTLEMQCCLLPQNLTKMSNILENKNSNNNNSNTNLTLGGENIAESALRDSGRFVRIFSPAGSEKSVEAGDSGGMNTHLVLESEAHAVEALSSHRRFERNFGRTVQKNVPKF